MECGLQSKVAKGSGTSATFADSRRDAGATGRKLGDSLRLVFNRAMEIGRFDRDWGRLFDPRTIAVVGASNSLGKWGFVMPMSIIGGGYVGSLFMVNPNEREVLGRPSYPTLADIDDEIDLVIMTIPARKVAPALEHAAAKGVKNVLVVASNFSEVGEDGAALELELARTANSLGAVSYTHLTLPTNR